MKRLAICAVLIAWPAYAEVLPPELIDVLTQDLNDPLSAQFRNVRKSDRHDFVVCGEMNAKNRYGGYVGFQKFWIHVELKEATFEKSDSYKLSAPHAGCN